MSTVDKVLIICRKSNQSKSFLADDAALFSGDKNHWLMHSDFALIFVVSSIGWHPHQITLKLSYTMANQVSTSDTIAKIINVLRNNTHTPGTIITPDADSDAVDAYVDLTLPRYDIDTSDLNQGSEADVKHISLGHTQDPKDTGITVTPPVKKSARSADKSNIRRIIQQSNRQRSTPPLELNMDDIRKQLLEKKSYTGNINRYTYDYY
jgi:hypothetical protein